MPMLIGNSTGGKPLISDIILSSNLPHTLLYIVTVIGTSEWGGKSPIFGVKTIAIPLLLERKNVYSFSSFFVCVKVSPVADENLAVCSCSSDKIACLNFFSGDFTRLFPNLVDPDLAEGANLIYLPPTFPGMPCLLSGELYIESFYLDLYCSSS